MTDGELDGIYTELCAAMTRLGEQAAPLFLGRFALLAIVALDEPDVIRRLIAEAAEDLEPAEPRADAT
jgi:hypothetical protein